jgi:glucose/arabinose dehydrogenase
MLNQCRQRRRSLLQESRYPNVTRPSVELLEVRRLLSVTPATSVSAAVGESTAPALVAALVRHPYVTITNPRSNQTGISISTAVSCDVALFNGGINAATVTSSTVYLYRTRDGLHIPASVNTSGAGDAIALTPKSPLAAYTGYTFVVTAGVRDVGGVSFQAKQVSFTTGKAPAPSGGSAGGFDHIALPTAGGRQFFSLAMGPDHKLYAGTADGLILRYAIKSDGALGSPQVIDSIRRANGGARFIVGLAFQPGSTASQPVLWVSHSATSSLDLGGTAGPDFTGKITRLTGANLDSVHDAVIHLPRSVRDHVTDQPVFGPDGALYVCQPSNSSMGAADPIWGKRPEHLLNAAILRLDLAKLGGGTVDARTADGGGTYNPYAAGAPLTIYATGVRNAFDLVWHSSGRLYAPTNGSAAGGNTPAGPGVPALTNVSKPETDFLFRIDRGGYYGHPNPVRHEYVLNGGNPTAGTDRFEVTDYPVGIRPDPNWRPAVFDFGAHRSPDGVIEYRGPAFGGALDHKLLVVRYSAGDDIIALKIASDGSVSPAAGVSGMSGLNDPVDLVEDPSTGNLYVSELGAQRITLLRVHNAGGVNTNSAGTEVVLPDSPSTDVTNLPRDAVPPAAEPPTSNPPSTTTPQSTPGNKTPGRGQRKLVARIQRIARRHGFTIPDITGADRRTLRTVLAGLRVQVFQIRKSGRISPAGHPAQRAANRAPALLTDAVSVRHDRWCKTNRFATGSLRGTWCHTLRLR